MWVLLSQVASKGMAEAKMGVLEGDGVFLVKNRAEIGNTIKQALIR